MALPYASKATWQGAPRYFDKKLYECKACHATTAREGETLCDECQEAWNGIVRAITEGQLHPGNLPTEMLTLIAEWDI